MKRRVLALAAIGLFASTTAFAQSAATSMFNATTLSLTADGQVKVDPDEAIVTVGVQTAAPTAAEAMRANAAQMTALIAALKGAGVADKDIQTSTLSLSAQYSYVQNEPPKLTGYQASNDVTVTVEELKRLGPAIDAATAAGANQVQGVAFSLKDPTAAQDQARLAAVKALGAKAALYEGALGYKLGRLVNLTEAGGLQQAPPRPLAMMSVRSAAPTPVESGELTVDIQVSAVYELTR
ncbi:MAG TPA: SIMPL domain-containing protein [Caulobacteraceae bacterium]|nr:SIMPL domain-containing protein [Caulobacteraceae bacterium]